MLTLRVFHTAEPFRELKARTVTKDEIVVVGRDPAADLHIEDAACELSRQHCALSFAEDRVLVRDLSANGTFIGPDRRRMSRDVPTEVPLGAAIQVGQFVITCETELAAANDHAPDIALDAPFHSPMLHEPNLSAASFQVRTAWNDQDKEVPARGRLPDAVLLEAFCEGAGLDPSMFMVEDPADVMRRAGAMYQQAVLGLSDLMSERTSTKRAYQMDSTSVGAMDNNPFKWAEPHRVAVDLLRATNGPFLAGASAINCSFQDLKKHLLCLMAGSRAAVATALDEVAPDRIKESAQGSLFQTKVDTCWREYEKRHAHVAEDARANTDSNINRAFKAGYEREVRKLDGLGTIS